MRKLIEYGSAFSKSKYATETTVDAEVENLLNLYPTQEVRVSDVINPTLATRELIYTPIV